MRKDWSTLKGRGTSTASLSLLTTAFRCGVSRVSDYKCLWTCIKKAEDLSGFLLFSSPTSWIPRNSQEGIRMRKATNFPTTRTKKAAVSWRFLLLFDVDCFFFFMLCERVIYLVRTSCLSSQEKLFISCTHKKKPFTLHRVACRGPRTTLQL